MTPGPQAPVTLGAGKDLGSNGSMSPQETPVSEAPTPAPRTIDDVLADLDVILEKSLAAPSRLGYFAALYRKVTAKVKEGIESGFFDDGPRMEQLDVVFASRYLDALALFESLFSPPPDSHSRPAPPGFPLFPPTTLVSVR